MKVFYNLNKKVIFCKKCTMSNQRPSAYPEFKHDKKRKFAKYLNIDSITGICDACKFAELKEKNINWIKREKELIKLCDKYRSNNGDYDCLVPGSGGKDSVYASYVLKYEYGMNPLTVTWPPIMYTDYGYENFKNWIKIGGFDNLTYTPNGKVMKLLTKLSIENLLHPFQTFILGQKNLAPKIANNFNIKLVFFGEHEAEYGNPIAETNSSMRKNDYFSFKNIDELLLAGCKIKYLKKKYNLTLNDLSVFLPIKKNLINKNKLEVHYLGYYKKWLPQEAYYYAVEKSKFKPRPFRTEGTYSKYSSIDDKIDDLHYYTTFIKYGLGRASYDTSQEIRNNHLTRTEALKLVKKFDGEFPKRYFKEIMEYLEMDEEYFLKLCDKFRSPHLWKKLNNQKYRLRHTVNSDGEDD